MRAYAEDVGAGGVVAFAAGDRTPDTATSAPAASKVTTAVIAARPNCPFHVAAPPVMKARSYEDSGPPLARPGPVRPVRGGGAERPARGAISSPALPVAPG